MKKIWKIFLYQRRYERAGEEGRVHCQWTEYKASPAWAILIQDTLELLQALGMGFSLTSITFHCLKKGWRAILGSRSLQTARWKRRSVRMGEPLLSNYRCLLGMCYWCTVRWLKPRPLPCSVMHWTRNFSHSKWSLLVIKLTSVDT